MWLWRRWRGVNDGDDVVCKELLGKLLLVSNYSGLCCCQGKDGAEAIRRHPSKTIFHVELRKLLGFLLLAQEDGLYARPSSAAEPGRHRAHTITYIRIPEELILPLRFRIHTG